MSEPSPQSPPPEKPTWFRRPATGADEATIIENAKPAEASVPAASPKVKASKPAVRAKRVVANVPQFFLTLNADAVGSHSLLTWKERLRHQWVNNREGFLTSLGLHGLLVLIFALYLLPMSGQGPKPPADWSDQVLWTELELAGW